MIRVVLVDDHKLVRMGIRKILETAHDITVVGEAECGETGVALCEEQKPDIVLMDHFMAGMGGMEATRRILSRTSAKVIFLTVNASGPLPKKAFDLGAHGFLTKSCGMDEMLDGVRKVHAGERYLSAEIARHFAEASLDGGNETPIDTLSKRELQVLVMMAEGQTPGKISARLNLSPKTVSTYRSRIFVKLNVETDVDLVRIAMRNGLVDPEPHPLD